MRLRIYILIATIIILFSGDAFAKNLRKMGSFITSTSHAKYAKKRSSVVVHGETIYFYYKIGNLLFKNANGAPFEYRLEVRRNMKLVVRTGWIQDMAVEPDSSFDNRYIKEYENSRTNLFIGENFRTGNYTAQIFFRDINTMREVEFNYGFSLTRQDLMKDYLRSDVTGLYKTSWGELELVQKGHRIRGFFDKNNGRLEGFIEGFKMWGYWVMEPSFRPPLDQGKFIFEFSRDGKNLFGRFRDLKERNWYKWEGYLLE